MKIKGRKYIPNKRNERKINFTERKFKNKVQKVENLKSKDPFYRRITRPLYTGGRNPIDTRTVMVTIEGKFTQKRRREAKAQGVDLPKEMFKTYPTDIDERLTPRKVVDHIADAMQSFMDENKEKYAGLQITNVYVNYVYR